MHGDERAREIVLEQHLPLVRALASRYAGRGEALEDLVQVGSIGLVLALQRFDPERGVPFKSFAIPTIVGEIRRHFRDRAWALHVPRRLKELSLRLTRTVETLTAELGRSPTIAELAKAVGVAEDEVIDALDIANAYSTRSLSEPRFDEDGDQDSYRTALGKAEAGFRRGRGPRRRRGRARRARPARAQDHRAALLRRPHAVGDRGRDRHLADARLAAAPAGSRGHARPTRGAAEEAME